MLATVTRPNIRRRGAFTLLEVLVVVAILVILASVGTISVIRYLEDARINKALLDMKNLQTLCKTYYASAGGYPSETMEELIMPSPEGSPAMLPGGEAALMSPWNNRYQMQLGADGEPYIFTTSDRGALVRWPKN